MNIVFLGSGNTATVLAKLAHQKGHTVLQVWSRCTAHAQLLAKQVQAEAITSLTNINTAADICVLAVTDTVVAAIASQLSLKKTILVHTAGSVAMQVLNSAATNYGVLYPLQSLRKELEPPANIPLLVNGNSDTVKSELFDLARTISSTVSFAGDEQRLQLHLGAVMVNNFTNHLYVLAQEYCHKQGLDFALLHPLIQETALRVQNNNAVDVQTGPALRNDEETIQRHLHLLRNNEALQKLYQMFTESIRLYHKNKELR
jgi:predicted short-subunit dehydrogenase-like oxidoreductase (DUF2520 family)